MSSRSAGTAGATVPAPAQAGEPVRRRPRERKRQIETAAALAFAERGYHQVSMNDVAHAVGISAPALYRHFPNKYALFAQTVFDLAHRLVEATADAAAMPIGDPEAARTALDMHLNALISTSIDLRATGGVYRWEGRYLEKDDRDRLTAEFRTLRERMVPPLRVYRPEVDEADAGLLVLAALASIASITTHRTVISSRALRTILDAAAWRLLDADLPDAGDDPLERAVPDAGTTRRERLVATAVAQFHARGYHEVSIEDIATAVDLTPSGVYRHFESKSALLMEACLRASAQLDAARVAAQLSSDSPQAVLDALCDDYVRHSFENYQLVGVWAADVSALDADDGKRMRGLQRAYLAEWSELLQRTRPELSSKDATVLVHAGFNVVADVAMMLRHRTNAATSRRVAALLRATLGVA
ncbi:AcrR family transcriptional regulator [Microbacterium terrae]|uniref:HTH-type transcriptional regulator BetI n=1 Tax=Microbacterium terrae TaxID=69369 RepID=A0A0M2H7N5_9MICO|nr:TetR/AcrR family transcriptional regulator [Microbacterium terrae]KJL40125.1 HTH-type transcriptional regulator BetI [Microbacterium terrae]MBP1079269.1 AcrR family transcriptional regulator [Microbacterium terrae]GLJ98668.1 TetR family transcriptional regulator [Microbacterium terrae]